MAISSLSNLDEKGKLMRLVLQHAIDQSSVRIPTLDFSNSSYSEHFAQTCVLLEKCLAEKLLVAPFPLSAVFQPGKLSGSELNPTSAKNITSPFLSLFRRLLTSEMHKREKTKLCSENNGHG